MELSAKTVYTKERLLRFNTFYVLSRRAMLALMAVSLILVNFAFILSLVAGKPDGLITFCFALVWFIVLFYLFMALIMPRISINKARSLDGVIVFTFGAESFRVEVSAKGQSSTNEIRYSVLEKVMESKQDIYLFISKTQCLIVDKLGFTEGTPDELMQLLKAQNVKIR